MTYSMEEEALFFLKIGSYKEAEAISTIVTTMCPFLTSSWMILGISRYFQGDIEKAENAFSIAKKLEKEAIAPLLWEIECLLKKEKREEASLLFSCVDKNGAFLANERLHIQQLEHIFKG